MCLMGSGLWLFGHRKSSSGMSVGLTQELVSLGCISSVSCLENSAFSGAPSMVIDADLVDTVACPVAENGDVARRSKGVARGVHRAPISAAGCVRM
jgi:hypothetical protein